MRIATLSNVVCISDPWTKIHNLLKPAGIAAASFALGVWVQSIHDGSASIPWLHQQAAALHQAQTVTIPNLAAVGGCQEKRANIAEGDIAAPNGLLACQSVGQALKNAVPPAQQAVPQK